jgi:hypothetical protein
LIFFFFFGRWGCCWNRGGTIQTSSGGVRVDFIVNWDRFLRKTWSFLLGKVKKMTGFELIGAHFETFVLGID